MKQGSGDERMAYLKLAQPMLRALLQVWASTITVAAALTSWLPLLPAGLRAGRMVPSQARHRRGRY